MESKVTLQQNQLRAPATYGSYGFPSQSQAISGVINLFFLFVFVPALGILLLNIIMRPRKNFLQNMGVSLLGGIISGIITMSFIFVAVFVAFNTYDLVFFITLAGLMCAIFLPIVVIKIIGSKYSNNTDKFVYGSAVYVLHVITLFIMYRILISYATVSGIFGPTYY